MLNINIFNRVKLFYNIKYIKVLEFFNNISTVIAYNNNVKSQNNKLNLYNLESMN